MPACCKSTPAWASCWASLTNSGSGVAFHLSRLLCFLPEFVNRFLSSFLKTLPLGDNFGASYD
jgi:hypothetical protein